MNYDCCIINFIVPTDTENDIQYYLPNNSNISDVNFVIDKCHLAILMIDSLQILCIHLIMQLILKSLFVKLT